MSKGSANMEGGLGWNTILDRRRIFLEERSKLMHELWYVFYNVFDGIEYSDEYSLVEIVSDMSERCLIFKKNSFLTFFFENM